MNHIKLVILCLFLATGTLLAGYSSQVQSDDPIAWWRFDDYIYNDGSVAEELTGNIEDSTFQGDVMTVKAGVDGRCAWFNGNKAGIDIGNELGSMLDGSSAITFETWMRVSVLPEGNLTQRIFATRIDGGKAGLDVSLFCRTDAPSTIRIGVRSCPDDPYLVASTPFSTTEQWVHLVCVADFSLKQVRIYLNGVLEEKADIDFASNVYIYGQPTQRDQIGRSPDISVPYRGYLDEVAVYDKALSLSRIKAHYAAGNPTEPGDLWVSQVVHDESRMVHSPSMHIYDEGTILSSYYNRGNTHVKISYDDGASWFPRAAINGLQFASMFEHDGDTYLFGITENPGHICITKSSDDGLTWTTPSILFEAQEPGTFGYHTGPVPVLRSSGHIYRMFERRVTDERWPMAYAAVVVWADKNSDLLDPDSWTMTNAVEFDSSWPDPSWNCTSPGWLEGNMVEDPNGNVVALMRYHTNPVVDKAAMLTLNQSDMTLNFDPKAGFIDMHGGMHKFHIRRDPVTGIYLTLNNNNTDPSRPQQRNTLSLVASDDLVNWRHVRTVLQDNSPMTWRDSMLNAGFQYVVWRFDGEDIVFVSRTAYDGAPNYHDSNRITFHRLENYHDFIDFPETCEDIIAAGFGLAGDINEDCYVDMIDFAIMTSNWLDCNDPTNPECDLVLY